ncbi:MAG: outer membrane protein assembly factor BamA [Gammaproteobacteria bacterium]|nr:outer membrane protein assembly factor BamA [Gammaproteobacteria bacterium]
MPRVFTQAVLAAILLGLAMNLIAAESFSVTDIELEGLQRIEAGTVFTYLPIEVGDDFDPKRSADILRELYKTGFFSDVSLYRKDDILLVKVKERPAISEINFSGNKDISDDDLTSALKGVGIAKGRVFNRSILERLENELLQQYFARGKYNVQVDTSVSELPRNRVDIDIEITEGEVAKIKQVNIVGNGDFDDEELKQDFDSGIPPWYLFLSSSDKYSKQKLAGDLEKLRTQYLDRGYLKFNIDSTQVSITPDKEDIYITINIDEGDKYSVNEVKLLGNFVVPEEELRGLLAIHEGEIFSRQKVVKTTDAISQRLGSEGYAFTNINPVPEVDELSREVSLTFFVDPGQRVYVRRINFLGNDSTRGEVFRREMRQLEGGWYSLKNINLSRRRLERLPFVESVDIKTKRVSGIDDLVDLDITISERLSGSFSVGAGFSQSQGVLFNLGLTQDNFLGTGKKVSIRVDNSRVNTIYSFSYTNPFHTIDGVSRGFSVSYTETEAGQARISDYNADQLSANINYGIPLTEVDTLRASGGLENTKIFPTSNTPDEILDFLDDNGDKYTNFLFTGSFIHDTRNRTVFADRGNLQRINGEFSVPGSDLKYYKAEYRNVNFLPISDWLTASLNGRVAYGDSYGGTTELPFFEKYFAGGLRTVRGYDSNSLGPRDSRNDPFGGDFRVIANAELFFPALFFENTKNVRLGVFFDAGNVFAEVSDFEFSELRTSAGVSMTWLSPVGALTFSLAQALNDKPGDETEVFQFSIGTVF